MSMPWFCDEYPAKWSMLPPQKEEEEHFTQAQTVPCVKLAEAGSYSGAEMW